jgi:hypothetical protein
MLDSALSIFDGCFAQSNETLQSRRNFLVGVGFGAGFAALVAQTVCQRTVQINDFVVLPCADAALRTKKNDLHDSPPVFVVQGSRFKVQSLERRTLNLEH